MPTARPWDAGGISLRLDHLARAELDDGSIARLIEEQAIAGIARDAADFLASLAAGTAYDEQFAQFTEQGSSVDDAILWARTDDVRRACDLLAPMHRSSAGADGYVSIAVDPRWAYDTEATLHDARRLRSVVGRDNLYVGVPATAEGMSATQQLLAEGISVGATAVYGEELVRQVVAAVLAGLEQAAGAEMDLSRISAALSVGMAAVDTEAVRDVWVQTSGGDFWKHLENQGARPLPLMWDTATEASEEKRIRELSQAQEELIRLVGSKLGRVA